MATDYSIELQKLFVEFMITDHELYVRCNNITSSDFFDRSLRSTVRFIQEHADQYGAMPALTQIKAVTGIELQPLNNLVDDSHKKWFLDEYETFCRHKAIERAILASTDKLEKKEYGAVEQLIKEAVSIGLAKELGMNYWESPEDRLRTVQEQRGGISTGWKTIDAVLYGGFSRGELNIWAGGSGSGKSLFLQNQALNWAQEGHNVVYVSLELSENLCAMRLDSMLTGLGTRDLFRNIDDVGLQIRMTGKKSGSLQIVQLPNGITVNDLKAYIKEYQIQTNTRVDAVLLDYLDLMMPAQRKVPPSDLFVKDKLVSEELRNFAVEGKYLFSTASQLNRSAVDEPEFDHSHISGGLSKIQTADNVMGIMATRAMKERGRIQIQFMKTRSSSGVGKKVELSYGIESMRIRDLAEDELPTEEAPSSMLEKLKQRTQVADDTAKPNIEHKINTDKLRSILKRTSD
jgi:replicative DNA helicase